MKKTSNIKSVNAQTQEKSPAAYWAVGRAVRAMTYPLIADAYYLSLTELNALATIAHIAGSIVPMDPSAGVLDTASEMMVGVGTGQAFNNLCDYYPVFLSLKAKGLIRIKNLPASKMIQMPRLKTDTSAPADGMLATLSKKGKGLLNAMAKNLEKALDALDHPEVRCSLATFREPARQFIS